MRVSEASNLESARVGSMRAGVLEQKFLLTGDDDSPNNYVLNVGRTGAGGWGTPRHRHNFDQIRYVLKGTYPLMPGKVMTEGSVAYFPESVHYGPQDRPEGLEMMVLQFGGSSGAGFLSVARREAANDALKKKGEFTKGVFTYVDENGQRQEMDGSAACFVEATGKELTFAEPRYSDVILMDPAAYEWIPTDAPGVHTKWLGSFTERNTRIGFIRVDADGVFEAGKQPSIEILFLSKGAVSVDGRKYEPYAAFEFQANEGPIQIKALEPSEFLCMVLPQF
jgi:hypothetical protein